MRINTVKRDPGTGDLREQGQRDSAPAGAEALLDDAVGTVGWNAGVQGSRPAESRFYFTWFR